MASALALAFVVYSCKSNLSEAEKLDLEKIPLQTVDDMFFVQSENGLLKMRVESPRMEVYEHDTLSYDLFPNGIRVYAYAEDGSLETTIVARKARHDKYPGREENEKWSVFGWKPIPFTGTTRPTKYGLTAISGCRLRRDICRASACAPTKRPAMPSCIIPSTMSS